MLKSITENTKISIGLITVFVGAVLWMSATYWNGIANAKEIEGIKEVIRVGQKEDRDYKERLQNDVSEVKSDVKVIKQILKEGN